MYSEEKIPAIVEAAIMVLFGGTALVIGWRRGKGSLSGRDASLSAMAFPMFLLVGVCAVVTFIFDMTVIMGQGTTVRADGVRANYGRWVQLVLCGVPFDALTGAIYLGLRLPRSSTATVASLVAWTAGIFAVLSTGNNMFFWMALGVVFNVAVVFASIRSLGDLPGARFYLVPFARLMLALGLWLVLVLAPSGQDVIDNVTANYLYMTCNTLFIVALGLFVAFTYESAAREDYVKRVPQQQQDELEVFHASVTKVNVQGHAPRGYPQHQQLHEKPQPQWN
jgi:hypothetical protein